MHDGLKALELMKEFIRLEREYRATHNSELLPRLQEIAFKYTIVNGSGDLFKVTDSEDLKNRA